jgi:hypothetical protein
MNLVITRLIKWQRGLLCLCLLLGPPIVAVGNTSRPESRKTDHLVPSDERIDPAYRKVISQRLFVTRANYARIMELPSPASVGESVVAIYSNEQNLDEAYITYTRAERNLYYAAFAGDPSFPNDPAIKIARCDAPFSKPVATAVSAAIKHLLAQSHPRRKSNLIILHGTDVEFAVEELGRGSVRGLLTPYAVGKNGATLRRLVQLIKKYCHANSVRRAVLAKQIKAHADELMR